MLSDGAINMTTSLDISCSKIFEHDVDRTNAVQIRLRLLKTPDIYISV